MDNTEKHSTEAVQYRFAPATECSDEDNEPEYDPKDYKEEQANIIKTLLSLDYIIAIQDFLGLPDWATDYNTIPPLYDSQCSSEWGLTVGKLEEILGTDEPIIS